jgi:6-pyruvoyl-tetrahydropterin synthase
MGKLGIHYLLEEVRQRASDRLYIYQMRCGLPLIKCENTGVFMKVEKRFTFEASHLLNHGSLHGHSYKLFVELSGNIIPETGMIITFEDFDALVNNTIVKHLEQAMIISLTNSVEIELYQSFIKGNNMKSILIDKPTTTENLVIIFFDRLKIALQKFVLESGQKNNLQLNQVRLYVNEDSSAVYSGK